MTNEEMNEEGYSLILMSLSRAQAGLFMVERTTQSSVIEKRTQKLQKELSDLWKEIRQLKMNDIETEEESVRG